DGLDCRIGTAAGGVAGSPTIAIAARRLATDRLAGSCAGIQRRPTCTIGAFLYLIAGCGRDRTPAHGVAATITAGRNVDRGRGSWWMQHDGGLAARDRATPGSVARLDPIVIRAVRTPANGLAGTAIRAKGCPVPTTHLLFQRIAGCSANGSPTHSVASGCAVSRRRQRRLGCRRHNHADSFGAGVAGATSRIASADAIAVAASRLA